MLFAECQMLQGYRLSFIIKVVKTNQKLAIYTEKIKK